jgi:hypothetical protein
MKITKFTFGNYGTTLGLLLDELQYENKLSKKKIDEIEFRHKEQIWILKKLK